MNVQDLESEAVKFLRQTKTSYPNVRDRDGVAYRSYALTGVPETFFIGTDGRIVRKFPGAVVEWGLWQKAIESAVSDARPAI